MYVDQGFETIHSKISPIDKLSGLEESAVKNIVDSDLLHGLNFNQKERVLLVAKEVLFKELVTKQ